VAGDIFFLELLHHKYPITATNKYGAESKYNIPVFRFEAI
jgi:hypothetical protein